VSTAFGFMAACDVNRELRRGLKCWTCFETRCVYDDVMTPLVSTTIGWAEAELVGCLHRTYRRPRRALDARIVFVRFFTGDQARYHPCQPTENTSDNILAECLSKEEIETVKRGCLLCVVFGLGVDPDCVWTCSEKRSVWLLFHPCGESFRRGNERVRKHGADGRDSGASDT